MAAGTKQTDYRRYRSTGAVDGNLARDLSHYELERQLEHSGELEFGESYGHRQEPRADRIARRRAEQKAAVRPKQKVSPLTVAGFAAVGAMLVFLLLCYVQLNTISNNIVTMKGEIDRLETEQISLEALHEQAFDTASVKRAAMAAGMGQPTDSQVCYVSLPGEDRMVSYAREETSVLSRFFATLQSGANSIMEYFE